MRPLDLLPVGHYATGFTADGEPVDIYRAAPDRLMSAATGLPPPPLVGWIVRPQPKVSG